MGPWSNSIMNTALVYNGRRSQAGRLTKLLQQIAAANDAKWGQFPIRSALFTKLVSVGL
jgi:hypothetical protein